MKPLKTLAAICAVAIIALSVVWLTPQGRYVISQMVYSHPSDSEASELTQLRNQLDTVPSGFRWPQSSDANLMGLQSLGVPREDIVVVDSPEAYDTAHELAAVGRYAVQQEWTRVLLVTSASHTRRARMIWRRVVPGITQVTVASAQPGFDHWWSSGRGRKAVLYEYGAITKELLRKIGDFFGDVVETAQERQAKDS